MIAVIDYGMGNIHSVAKATQLAGARVLVTDKPEKILAADKVVLPGVGAFCDGVEGLKERNLTQAVLDSIKKGKCFLGICLGMQLLFEQSEESGDARGLGVLRGTVKKFNIKGFKVPHIGWNQIDCASTPKHPCRGLLKDIPSGTNVYFCHSYYAQPQDESIVAATSDYGIDFAAVINRDNVFGVQFHPEKSLSTGLKILKNFVEL
ncbi:MAG: imidazole glycerol phosphate synthase subunit HisH [Candidatus Omnitrophota bacterium]